MAYNLVLPRSIVYPKNNSQTYKFQKSYFIPNAGSSSAAFCRKFSRFSSSIFTSISLSHHNCIVFKLHASPKSNFPKSKTFRLGCISESKPEDAFEFNATADSDKTELPLSNENSVKAAINDTNSGEISPDESQEINRLQNKINRHSSEASTKPSSSNRRKRFSSILPIDDIQEITIPNSEFLSDAVSNSDSHLRTPIFDSSSSHPPLAWFNSRAISEPERENQEKETIQLIKDMAMREKQEILDIIDSERIVEIQERREFLQQFNIRKTILKLQGRLKGTQWEPVKGEPIFYSVFCKLLDDNQVNYVEYAEHGKHFSVILPYVIVKNKKQQIIWARHTIKDMPADTQTEIWEKLHPQIMNIDFKYPYSPINQILPLVPIMGLSLFRLSIAFFIFIILNAIMKPLYKPTRLRDRPGHEPQSLQAQLASDLGTMGESRARFISAEETTGVTFDDFAGQEYVKRELKEVVRLLKGDEDYMAMGVYCPKGVMLYGPPGTGKTLLARAVAGEAGLPFFSVSGSEFVEMFVGVAASRVRNLFDKARAFAPSIVFIDEIDAIATSRGSGESGGGNIEREQGLLQLLTEMDGFEISTKQVLVIGATNRLDMIDAALLRKGRFDKCLPVLRPNDKGRLDILKVHSKNKRFRSEEEKEIILDEISQITIDYSGADLQNLLNEAAILCMRKEKQFIEREDLMESITRQGGDFKTGQEDKIDVTGEAKVRIAYREAASCVLNHIYPPIDSTFNRVIISDLSPQTRMEFTPVRHAVFAKKVDMINDTIRAFAPLLVEEMIFGKRQVAFSLNENYGEATQLAEYIVLATGQTALGIVVYETEGDIMPHMRPKVIALRDEILRYCLNKCRAHLVEYRSALETIAETLINKDEILAEEVEEICNSAPLLPQPYVREIDEYGAIMNYTRWGIYGLTLPGRATFCPGNAGFVTFGAPRPTQVPIMDPRVWETMDNIFEDKVREISNKSKGRRYGDLYEVSQVL